jgi:hypothetical protein
MPPIFDELSRQSSELENERAMLLITDVKVSPVSAK